MASQPAKLPFLWLPSYGAEHHRFAFQTVNERTVASSRNR